MVTTAQCRRLAGFATVLSLALLGLAGRLVYLQYFSHEKFRDLAEKKRIFLQEPRRGDIVDANGNPLATSVPVKKVYADPGWLAEHYTDVAKELAPLLQYREADLAALLKPVIRLGEDGTLSTNRYVDLDRKLAPQNWERVQQTLETLNFKPESELNSAEKQFYRGLRRYAIAAVDDQLRIYPSRNLAAHVVGYVQDRETSFNNIHTIEMVGIDGIERWFDQKLAGQRGWRVTETDVKRREIVVYRSEDVQPKPGLNVVLTLDMIIQNIVETELTAAMREHDPVSASAVVVRPATGEVLAMVSLPDFDLNQPGKTEMDYLRNRVITDLMEPGSTFKIVAVSAALNERIVTMEDTFDCENGMWRFYGRYLRDHAGYGTMTVENIIVKSSNIGTAKIGIRLGEDRLYEYVRAFGFGFKTGVTLSGEVKGIVHHPKDWDKLTISRIPMGQAVAVTHLQSVMAMSAIANEGRLMRPMLVKRLQEQDGQIFAEYPPQAVRQVVSPAVARQITSALKKVPSVEGTAARAELEHYTVAGKTGTAEKAGRGGYLPDKYVASFIGFFPASQPEVCISVVVDEPDPRKGYYGGRVAAPVFKRIAEQVAQYLKIRPDREEAPPDNTTSVAAGEKFRTASVAAP